MQYRLSNGLDGACCSLLWGLTGMRTGLTKSDDHPSPHFRPEVKDRGSAGLLHQDDSPIFFN